MKNRHFVQILSLIFLVSCISKTDPPEKLKIIPQPVKGETKSGFFTLDRSTKILVPEGLNDLPEARYLRDVFSQFSGLDISIGEEGGNTKGIHFKHIKESGIPSEGYELLVDKERIEIQSPSRAGYFFGIQTLLQLLPVEFYNSSNQITDLQVPCCTIRDYPRFSWRGMHLDVSRHFFKVEFIKRYIDLIAMHKMNVFHWHLTDDNGWRIEIKKYPELTEKAAWRVDREQEPWRDRTPPKPDEKATYGGFYTQEQIREIVAYAGKRHITVVPEIEMPGHTSEVFAAFPELSCRGEKLDVQPGSYWPNMDIFCAGKEETFQFIEDVLTEVFGLFPSEYVHIGGDEATKTRWRNCSLCQERIRNEGLADEDELQSWFIRRVEKFLMANNKRLVGWDEILEGGLAPDATVMSWRGMKGGIESAQMGHDVIMCPTSHCYFDYYQANPDFEPEAIGGLTTLKEVYHFDPVPAHLESSYVKHILGGQGNVWTEYIATREHAEYMALPRMTALAEVLWSPPEQRDWESFLERLQTQKQRFDLLGINYSDGSWKVDINPEIKEGVYFISLSSEQYDKPIYFTLDGQVPDLTARVYEEPVRIDGSTTITAALFDGGKLMEYPNKMELVFHLATGMQVSLDHLPSPNYSASGPGSLVDGITGTEDFRDGYWMGFEGSDFIAQIDLEEAVATDSVSVRFLQNTGSWIFFPETVTVSLLSDEHEILSEKSIVPESTWEVKGTIIEELKAGFDTMNARYIRIRAPGMQKIPSWHEGAGNKGWLFIDEAIIRGPN